MDVKSELSSVDVRILANELENRLKDSRVKNIYQIADKELKVRIYRPGEGRSDLIIASNFFTLTRYERPSPKTPSTFAMKLRKHLRGGFLREVRQHEFDRVVNFVVETKEGRFFLIAEIFGAGNVILTNSDMEILSVLEPQKWKHRKLAIGAKYKYPPAGANPLELDRNQFKELIQKENRKIASILTVKVNLGGLMAEETCLRAGVEKSKKTSELEKEEIDNLFQALENILIKVHGMELDPKIVEKNGKPVDAIPFPLEKHEKSRKRETETFFRAVDEVFSKLERREVEEKIDDKLEGKREKLEKRKENQKQAMENLKEKREKSKTIGDVMFQRYQELEEVLNAVKTARDKDYSWEEINEELAGRKIRDIEIEKVNKDGTVVLKTTTDK